ncbi:hypothetical protein ACWOAQ_02920 [Helcococcus kunzii]|uniref:hypothetical protein n=1 Tax=Helcococcus kunzii TaxID=40091 RepID=UPI001C951125|nr:hypothetical protein [Helcococcus kunzii]QZO76642.1 hypothetical protein HIF96_01045 [Helcococcus kunzii]
MIDISTAIKEEFKKLDTLLLSINVNMKIFPEGKLKIKKVNNKFYYYHVLDDSTVKFIPKKDIELAKVLCKKSYYEKLKKIITKQMNYLKYFPMRYNYKNIENVYNNLAPERKALINPIEPSLEQFIMEWKNKYFTPLSFRKEEKQFITNNKELVRSKSEKILADLFSSYNLIYKYECPLFLDKYDPIYPDFTFICPYTKREIYWEHFGMMDNPEYAIKAIEKIRYYAKHEILLGDRLFVSFETIKKPLDVDTVKKTIKRFLVCSH